MERKKVDKEVQVKKNLTDRQTLSVIIPSFNEERMIKRTADVIAEILLHYDIENEIIFVDDGSQDNTWSVISSIAENSDNIRGLHFSRNFGKESAIMAGLTEAIGDCCVVLDCDLQHPPQKIVEMYYLWKQGNEVIEGRKHSRGKETTAHGIAAKVFYAIISKATGFDMENASDFKMLDRRAVDVLINMHEKNAFFRALSSWIGFKTAYIEFDVQERKIGETKWSTKALLRYALSNISAFSTAPMQLVTVLGILMLIVTVIFGLISLIEKLMGVAEPGFTTVILILLFSSSIIMISLGIIGYYIARIYEEIQGRPRYIISHTCGYKNDKEIIG